MSKQEEKEQEATELTEVYVELRKEAKELVKDLSEGVRLWRAMSILLLLVSVLGFFLLYLYLNPATIRFAEVPVEYFATALMGAASLLGAGFSAWKFGQLRGKYRKLFEASQKLR